MIYLFYGTDREKVRGEWRKVVAAFQKKHPQGDIFRFSADNFDATKFEELMAGGGLFGDKRLIVGDELSQHAEALELIVTSAAELVASSNTFILAEEKPPAEMLKSLTKAGAKIAESKNVEYSVFNKNQFNIFSLADALGERDRKRLWLLYQEAQMLGLAAEEIFWKLVWQTKMMLLVKKSADQPLKRIKPFVAGKAARFARNYELGELESLSGELVALWHESKNEAGRDFEIGLEKLILSV